MSKKKTHLFGLLILLLGVLTACGSGRKPQEQSDGKEQAHFIPFKEDPKSLFLLSAEMMPSFMGGDLATFYEWVRKNLKYPPELVENAIVGRTVASFVVERDGSVSCVTILSTPHEAMGKEVVRVVESSPEWTPGQNHGKSVRVKLLLPIDFREIQY